MTLREADQLECARGGMTPDEAVEFSLNESLQSFAIYVEGELVGVWGYHPHSILGDLCQAWFLSTPEIERHKLAAARESKRVVSFLLSLYPEIIVQVDKSYTLAVNWLQWLGFEVTEKEDLFLNMSVRRVEWDS